MLGDITDETIFEACFGAVDNRPTTKPGGRYRINMLPTTVHVYFGKVTGAMPDGRPQIGGQDRSCPNRIVRVAGTSDYFLDCSVDLQNKIIRRTEHQGF